MDDLVCWSAMDSSRRFARECQVTAGYCLPPTNMIAILSATWRALLNFEPVFTDVCPSLVTAALLGLARHALGAAEKSSLVPLPEMTNRALARPRVLAENALRLVAKEHTGVTFGLSDAAERLGVSSYYLSHVIATETGYTFVVHRSGLRVVTGLCMLADTSRSIHEVAARSGYHHSGEFSRDITRWIGVTPTVLRSVFKTFS
jgi:AraC-like DNA-binding protein